ncbi:MAG: hypothetical protein SFV52_09830 [Saprospiraceae bacterium]|nr:hypothetical protein [Saprospiraceae bacterium]
MHDLIELVGLVNKTKLKSTGLWSAILEPQSKMEQLFEGIYRGDIASDEHAKSLLGDAGEEFAHVASLKNKLKERLLDTVFLLDFKDTSFSNRQKAFYECYKKWAAAMILLIRNARICGIDILEKLLRHAMRFEFTELTLDILRVLRLQYSTVEGDLKKYDAIREQYDHYEQLWLLESRAERNYTDMMIRYTHSKSTKTEVADMALRYYEELKPSLERYDSFKLHLFGRLIHLTVYSSANDYATTARICEEAIAFFDGKDYDSGLPLQVFYYNLIVCYLQMREFEKGQDIVNKSENLFEKGSFNWFKVQELFFLLAMHTRHYEKALQVYLGTIHQQRFTEQPDHVKEMWRIYQAYLHYLTMVGRLHPLDNGMADTFRFRRFMNEIPIYSRDKRGMNISVLIIQILFALAEKKYDQTWERMESINKYCSRYLKENDTFRSNCFIKMLLLIPEGNFHRENVARKTAKYFKMLDRVPIEVANQTYEVEIIPYEHLWEMAVDTLDLRLYRSKVKKARITEA